MADYVTLLEVRYKAVCQELHDVTAKRNELALKLDEYEHRAKLHMDRCRHDMERIVRLEQQLETRETELADLEQEAARLRLWS